ncbi:MAG: hypothetical protein U9R42_10150 [Bacteroidota bacterium]|nr:hypothetical protein [Bacteroidota bacterium]
MKHLKYLIFSLVIFLLLQVSSCREKGCEAIKKAPQEFLDYWYFPEGSWWVYQNQDGEIDTVKCFENKIEHDYDFFPCVFQYLSAVKHSNKKYFYQKDYPQYSGHNFQGLNFGKGNCQLRVLSFNDYYSFSTILNFPFKIGDILVHGEINDEIRIKKIADSNSIEINNTMYYNSIHILQTVEGNINIPEIFAENIWLSKNTGLIKVTYFNGEYWELINHFINK